MLAAAGSLADAAEAHGSLCGALCSMSPYKMQDWVNEILPDGASLSDESAAMIERVFTATAASFGEQGMEFQPLLPDDEQPLNGRANALALWCTGFLYGLGTGQISDLEALNGDVGEIVRDFTEISRASGDDAEQDDSNEQAYAELVEFIRVAAQVVFEELLPLRQQSLSRRSAAAALTLVGLEGCARRVTSGRMDRQEFARRRRQFMRMIGKDAIAVLPAAPVRHRNGDIEYAYRQDSQFYYLSGFPEPDAVAVLVPGRPQAEYLLFVREHDALRETWDGAWAGTDGAVERYGADDAFPIADIDEILPGLMEQRSRIFYSMGTHLEFDPRMLGWVNGMRVHARQGSGAPQEFVALGARARRHASLQEPRRAREASRRAAQIAVGAHRRAMRFVRPGRMEYEVMAEILHEFRSHNADLSYHPIVGGGANSLRHALPRQRSAAVRRRLAAARRGLRARLLRLRHHAAPFP